MPRPQAAKTLDIYFIEVERGQSTLLVSPSGQSLLIDAGYAGYGGRDADRIAKAAKAAGVKRIDYLLITHFHSDHVGGVPNLLGRLPVAEFIDHGPSVEEQPWAADAVKARRSQNGKDDPFTHCLPGTPARIHTVPFLRKIVQTPGLLVFLSEANASYRQIFTDGRSLPEDPNPSWNGYSIGHWEGDTLVVETNGFRDGQWLDRLGSPLTDGARMTEKFRRLNFGTGDRTHSQ